MTFKETIAEWKDDLEARWSDKTYPTRMFFSRFTNLAKGYGFHPDCYFWDFGESTLVNTIPVLKHFRDQAFNVIGWWYEGSYGKFMGWNKKEVAVRMCKDFGGEKKSFVMTTEGTKEFFNALIIAYEEAHRKDSNRAVSKWGDEQWDTWNKAQDRWEEAKKIIFKMLSGLWW